MKIAEPSDTRSVIKNNIDGFIDSYKQLTMSNNNLSRDIKKVLEENKQLRDTKKRLLKDVKHLSELNGEYRRERHDMEDKLIEATTPWYVKLKDKLPKLGIRNPFYLMQD